MAHTIKVGKYELEEYIPREAKKFNQPKVIVYIAKKHGYKNKGDVEIGNPNTMKVLVEKGIALAKPTDEIKKIIEEKKKKEQERK